MRMRCFITHQIMINGRWRKVMKSRRCPFVLQKIKASKTLKYTRKFILKNSNKYIGKSVKEMLKTNNLFYLFFDNVDDLLLNCMNEILILFIFRKTLFKSIKLTDLKFFILIKIIDILIDKLLIHIIIEIFSYQWKG